MDLIDARKAYEYADSHAKLWWSRYDGCYRYAIPNRNNYWQQQEGGKKDMFVYDSTPINAVKSFVAKTQSSLTPVGINWCTLKSGTLYSKSKGSSNEVDDLLQIVSQVLFDYLRKSNFDTAVAESYYDLGVGTASLEVMETDDPDCPIWFNSVSQYLVMVYEDYRGMLNNTFREHNYIRYDQIQKRFPKAVLPNHLLQEIALNPTGEFPMTEAWLLDKNDKFVYIIGNKGLSETYYWEEEIESSPFVNFRWSKLPGENYGRGPIMDVISDIRTLNKLAENFIKQTDLVVNPPYMAYTDSVINPFTLIIKPGITIPVRPGVTPGQKPLEPLFSGGNFELGEWQVNRLVDNINKALFVNPIGEVSDPTKTATEISYRAQLYAEEIGPAYGRLQQEFLNPLIKRCIYILKKKGLLPAELSVDGNKASISYESPIVQNQRQTELTSLTQFGQGISQVLGPDQIMAVIDVPKTVIAIADYTGVDRKLIKSEADLTMYVKQLQDITQQQLKNAQNPVLPNVPQGQSVLPQLPQGGVDAGQQ
jgi:hypothetical protein